MKRFKTSIKKLVDAERNYRGKSIFLSNWDAELETISLPSVDFQNKLHNKTTIGSYYYWTDELNYKTYFQNYFQQEYGINLSKERFLISSNGSSSIMLSLMALKELTFNKVLAFTPIYFSTINLFELLGYQMYRFDLDVTKDFSFLTEDLENKIEENNIEILFITDPIFSSGIEFTEETYRVIFDICKKHDVWVVIDYIYGGMNWNDENYVVSRKIAYIVQNYTNYVVIESIAKRLFINGIKTATIFSEPNIIKKISRLSIYTVGSMCCLQLEMFKNIYNPNNTQIINSLVKENITIASQRFNKITSLLQGKNCIISSCNCSYFFLMGIPHLNEMDDIDFSIHILNQTGVLTVPHSRYLLLNKNYYFFRVNLLIDENDLFTGILKISNLL